MVQTLQYGHYLLADSRASERHLLEIPVFLLLLYLGAIGVLGNILTLLFDHNYQWLGHSNTDIIYKLKAELQSVIYLKYHFFFFSI